MSSSDSNDEHVLLLSQIKGAFECVICLDIPTDVPIPQCENGHILCRACRDKVLYCPVCKVKLGKSRCLAAEKVLELCPRPCEFEAIGCKTKLIPSKLLDHIRVCKFAPIRCVYPSCEVTSPLKARPILIYLYRESKRKRIQRSIFVLWTTHFCSPERRRNYQIG